MSQMTQMARSPALQTANRELQTRPKLSAPECCLLYAVCFTSASYLMIANLPLRMAPDFSFAT